LHRKQQKEEGKGREWNGRGVAEIIVVNKYIYI
jgi:hypothetical protein